MSRLQTSEKSRWACLRGLRLMLIAAAALTLTARHALMAGSPDPSVAMQAGEGLPPQAYTGALGDGYTVPAGVPAFMQGQNVQGQSVLRQCPPGQCPPGQCPSGQGSAPLPLPNTTFGPWKPAGIAGPWPPDEYICDGGDRLAQIHVRADWRIDGLQPEDTIAHYDTLDGQTVVQPTNRVCIYAPRFAAVRKVDILHGDNQFNGLSDVDQPLNVVQANEKQTPFSSMQPIEPSHEVGAKQLGAMVKRQTGIDLSTQLVVGSVQDHLKPYENFSLIRTGMLNEEDKPILAQRLLAATTWSADQGLQVTIDGRQATVAAGDQKSAAVFTVDVPNHPQLQLCKIASTDNARPGETIDFTIRFDNVGDQKMGNVTIVDSLTTRLEYVPDSDQSSRKAAFSTKANDAGSLVLRWELADPLGAGQGGVVRFRCKVR